MRMINIVGVAMFVAGMSLATQDQPYWLFIPLCLVGGSLMAQKKVGR